MLRLAVPCLTVAAACMLLAAPALAATGGASAASRSGGSAFGAPIVEPVPRVGELVVAPRTVVEGRLPSIRLRIDHAGAARVRARVVVWSVARRSSAARIGLGRVRTGRRVRVRWPSRASLPAGTYHVRLHARDDDGRVLARSSRRSGRVVLRVRPKPAPPAARVPPPSAPSRSGVFPVAGPHTLGSAGSKFGAGRRGHTHEGHDVLAAEGVPVVAPVAGTVTRAAYQAGGAGWYVVLAGADGRSYFFAHCQAGSVAVADGASVVAGARLCNVGSTGSASGPHLHFEIWVGGAGWRTAGSRPIDPLPDLLAWGG